MPRKFFLAQYFQSILECFLLNFDHFLATNFNADPACLGTELPGVWLKDKTGRIFPVFAEDVGEQDQR